MLPGASLRIAGWFPVIGDGARRICRIVAIGGGTGLPTLLRGLKHYTSEITAVVTVTDDGGSSGRLRGELGIPPPGDIRNCLVALAGAEPLMERLFQYRFDKGSLKGHSFGNLFIGALTGMLGDFEAAVRAASAVLRVHGCVLPSTSENVQLGAVMSDGAVVTGETAITRSGKRIKRVFLRPEGCKPVPAVIHALMQAELIVLGPGSLYTSIIPNLLVEGVAQAIRESGAEVVTILNIMTQPGETDGYTAHDHLQAIASHLGPGLVKHLLVNNGPIDPERLERYAAQGAYPVVIDRERIAAAGIRIIEDDIVSRGGLIRHDPDRLARALIEGMSTMHAPQGQGKTVSVWNEA